jgi:hypothetical protein
VPAKRLGELSADDLLAVALEDGSPLLPGDALALASACDLSASALGLSELASTSSYP